MEDMHASKSGKEEITDGGDNRSLLNLEAEKLVDDEAMEFQSPNASITQEPTGMESYRAGTCEAHGKKPNKKPNKPLPCPRCESFDTKFCYFNNYNINQPRHFCRKCQRYWTAGGSLRNVTTGAGRRRSKSNTTHPKHGVLSDAKALGCNTYNMAKGDAKADLLRAQTVLATLDAGQLVSEDGLSTSSTMLSFGQEKAENVSLSLRIGNTERDCPVKQDEKGVNLGLNHNFDIAKDNLTSTSTWHGLPGAMWSHPPWLLVHPGPLSLDWANAYWHMPSFLAAVASSSSSMQSHGLQAGRPENKGDLLTPKTLRINDPVEAAQSSIWKTLGLDKAPGSSASKEGIKKASQLEAGTQTEKESSSPSQHCNPAALSRSLTFNETS